MLSDSELIFFEAFSYLIVNSARFAYFNTYVRIFVVISVYIKAFLIMMFRYNLSSMVMLKDNHIWSVGNIAETVKRARKACGFSSKIEVECRSVTEALEGCSAGADIIMLDNFDSSVSEDAAKEIKSKYPNVTIEVSGGLCEENIGNYMTPNVDVLSASCLTQGYKTVDFSMKLLVGDHNPENPVVKQLHK